MTYRRLLSIGLAVLCAIALTAAPMNSKAAKKNEPKPPKHYIDLHAGAGVGSFNYPLEGGKTTFGISFAAGVGYTWFFRPFIGLQTGLSFTRIATTATLIDEMQWTGLTDYAGDEYIHHASFSDWTEKQQAYLLEVPLGLRFRYFANSKSRVGLHAAFGAKLALPIIVNYKHASGSVTHYAWYEYWQLELRDLPGRFETETVTTPQEESVAQRLNVVNAEAYAELGIAFRAGERTEIHIAPYAQYMLNDFCAIKRDDRTPLGFANAHNNYIFMSEYRGLIGTDKVGAMHPWVAGLKIGVSVWPGKTEKQKKKELKKLAKEYPELMSKKEVHDTIYLRDTIYIRDTVVKQQPASVDPKPMTAAQKQLDDLLSQAVIWFPFDKSDPILEPAYILDSVATMMLAHPELRIHINGHACKIGTEQYNLKLALRRAMTIADMLREKGIADDRMFVKTYGAKHPFRYNSEHQLSKDRRVEIIPEQ
ncbi:MAG: OmpA family protein [Paludibacteraceae bacterium]|nr:OmpA family protein [Paludibacteraceae bacterium]